MSLPVEAASRNIDIHRDSVLLHELQRLDAQRGPLPKTRWGMPFRNSTLSRLAQQHYTPDTFAAVKKVLSETDALKLHTHNEHAVSVDGIPQTVTAIAATEAKTNGDMSEMVWIRDQSQAARSLIMAVKYVPDKGSKRYMAEKKMAGDVTLSTMHLLSTEPQLDRFQSIISDPSKADDYLNWPQIAIKFTRLDSHEPTEWRHNQEAFQMAGLTAFEAIDTDILTVHDLAKGNKKAMASMMPFLAAVDFTNRENCGSWEEVPAVRTSVIGVETALLHQISEHAANPDFAFLEEGFTQAKGQLLEHKDQTSFQDTSFDTTTSFGEAVDILVDKGLRKIGQQLPFESPDYDPTSPKHCMADVALLYLLDYDIPKLLADRQIPIVAAGGKTLSRREIEDMILAQMGKLYDPKTHGFFRYGVEDQNPDTYLMGNYATDGMQQKIKEMKNALKQEANGGAIDLDEKRRRRAQIVPKGRPAAWVHQNAQLSAWANRRYKETHDEHYLDIATETYNRALSMATGEDEHHSLLNGDGSHHVQKVPAFRFPECLPTMTTPDGKHFVTISPNVPLSWATAKMNEATVLLEAAIIL